MMDRDKKDKLPMMQVGFIDSICMPVYKVRYENTYFYSVYQCRDIHNTVINLYLSGEYI